MGGQVIRDSNYKREVRDISVGEGTFIMPSRGGGGVEGVEDQQE